MRAVRISVIRPDAVELLFNARASRVLAAFFENEQTLSTAAAMLGTSPSGVSYWTPRLLDAGLVVEVRTEARRGAPMRWYQTPAAQFFVPYALAPSVTRTRLLESARRETNERLSEIIEQRLADNKAAGFTFTSTQRTMIDIDLEPDPATGTAPWTAYSGTLRLTSERARSLMHDTSALIAEHRQHEGGTTEVVISLAAAVAPPRRTRHRRTT